MKNALIVLLVLAGVGLGAGVWLTSRAPSAPAPAAVAPSPDDAERVRLEKAKEDLEGEVARLRAQLDEERRKNQAKKVEQDLAGVLAESAPAPRAPAAGDPMADLGRALSTILTNRALTASGGLFAGARAHQRAYARLGQSLGLDAEQSRRLERLLQQRRFAEWTGNDGQLQAADAGLKELLGARYGELEARENQIPAEVFTERFTMFMEGRQTPLSADSRNRLALALAGVEGLDDRGGMDREGLRMMFQPGQQTDVAAVVDEAVARTENRYDKIMAAAQPALSAEEYQAFDEYVGTRMEQQEMGAGIAKAVMPSIVQGVQNLQMLGEGTNAAVGIIQTEVISDQDIQIEAQP